MRILHCCLSCFYIDNYTYQENVLPIFNKKHGHEVEIIASTETFIDNKHLGYIAPSTYYTSEGIKVTRVPYRKILPHMIMKKVRAYKGVYNLIKQFRPNVILFHGPCAYELLTVTKYVKKNENVILYVDSHEDFNNSATNFISRKFLHSMFYRNIIHRGLPFIKRILYVGSESRDFLIQIYRVPSCMLEYYPLGGELVSVEEQQLWRKKIRSVLNINDDTIVIMHSGKLDKLKNTEELIEGINKAGKSNVVLLVAGVIPEANRELNVLMQSNAKVKWLGWLKAEELRHYLYASDIYAQPGSQSATMQNAICCGLPVMLYPHKSYLELCKKNVIWVKTSEDICNAIKHLEQNRMLLEKMTKESIAIAETILDYDKLAERIEK